MSGAAPTVSVVLPTYRRPDLVERALGTVRDQTYGDWELLVIDDNGAGSEAQVATEAVVAKLAAIDPRVAYRAHPRNRGACAARNTGIEAARGRYVAFLDDDDAWRPEKLARQVACFEAADPTTTLVYGGLEVVEADGRRRAVPADGSAHQPRALLLTNGIGTTSLVLCRREALLAVGGFDEELPAMQDYDLYLRLADRGPFACVPEPLVDKHRHAGATIGKDLQAIARANERFYLKHRARFVDDPVVHHQRLRWFGEQLLRAERWREGRRRLWQAWRVHPRSVGTLALALAAHPPVVAAYRALRRGRGA